MLLTLSLSHLRGAISRQGQLSICTQNARFLVPSEHDKWDIILQGGTAIAYEVVQNLPQMHNADGRCFWQHFSVIYRSHQFHINQHWLSNCTQNARVFGTLSVIVWQMGWCATRRDIHCSWSVSKPSLDAQDRWEAHRIAYVCNSWVLMCHSLPTPTLKLHQKYQIWVSAQYGKWDDVLQGATTIAYEVFQNRTQVHEADGRQL